MTRGRQIRIQSSAAGGQKVASTERNAMRFGNQPPKPKRGLPPRLRKQLMIQAVFLLLAVGFILMLMDKSRDRDDELLHHVGRIANTGSPSESGAPSEGGAPQKEDGLPQKAGPDGVNHSESSQNEDSAGIDIDGAEEAQLEPMVDFVEDPGALFLAAALEAKGEVDPNAIAYLLHKSRSRGDAVTDDVPILSEGGKDNVWELLVAEPHKYRGRLIEVRGNLVAVKPDGPATAIEAEWTIPTPNPSGIPFTYRSYIYGDDGKLFIVNTWKKARELKHMDGVVFRGYFAQLYSYDWEGGNKSRQVKIPLLIGRDLEYIEPPVLSTHNIEPLYYIAIVLPLIAGLVILILSWRSKPYRVVRGSISGSVPRRGAARASGVEGERASDSKDVQESDEA